MLGLSYIYLLSCIDKQRDFGCCFWLFEMSCIIIAAFVWQIWIRLVSVIYLLKNCIPNLNVVRHCWNSAGVDIKHQSVNHIINWQKYEQTSNILDYTIKMTVMTLHCVWSSYLTDGNDIPFYTLLCIISWLHCNFH
jgi:hypothetical protein